MSTGQRNNTQLHTKTSRQTKQNYVPMLIVAPSGNTNVRISSGTRPDALTQRSVTGSVAADDAHANAVVCAGTINFR
jgi:hypothetical protein